MVTAKKSPVKAPVAKPAAPSNIATKATPVVAKPVALTPIPAPKLTIPAPLPKAAGPAKPNPAKTAKAKKPKLVRDSFTIPKSEYAVMDELKQRGNRLGQAVKKSELLRAGIKALAAMSDQALLAALKAVPAIKTGRPAKD